MSEKVAKQNKQTDGKKDSVKVFYLRDERKQPVVLVATDMVDDENLIYAIAVHNPKDTFNRDMARTVALGRLHKLKEFGPKENRVFFVKPGVRGQIVKAILEDTDPQVSVRAHRAAQVWLNTYRPEQREQRRVH